MRHSSSQIEEAATVLYRYTVLELLRGACHKVSLSVIWHLGSQYSNFARRLRSDARPRTMLNERSEAV